MKRKTPPAEREEIPASRIIERPDGFWWRDADGSEYGPFPTLAEAEVDMQEGAENLERESLEDAESELGISSWIDPDSGVPAEDNVPRIEDH